MLELILAQLLHVQDILITALIYHIAPIRCRYATHDNSRQMYHAITAKNGIISHRFLFICWSSF